MTITKRILNPIRKLSQERLIPTASPNQTKGLTSQNHTAGLIMEIKVNQGQIPIPITINPRALHLQDRITVTEAVPTLRQSRITAVRKAQGKEEHRWVEVQARQEVQVHQGVQVHRDLQNRGDDWMGDG